MTNTKKRVMAISGSTRTNSTNLQLIHAIAALAAHTFDIDIYNEIATLPHFNPDLDHEPAPDEVNTFRQRLAAADGILICTPEYAMGVPGSLKNVIDWTVSSNEFYEKPTALITASSVGQKGHAALMETLRVIQADVTAETQLIVPFVKTKIKEDTITDAATLAAVQQLISAFHALMEATPHH